MSSADGFDVWYRNETTGGVFGFSLPLHPGVAAQVDAKNLVRCPPPGDGPETSSPTGPQADGLVGDGLINPDDEMLNVCSDCGSTAARGPDGGWLDQCAGCAKKRAAAARKPTK